MSPNPCLQCRPGWVPSLEWAVSSPIVAIGTLRNQGPHALASAFVFRKWGCAFCWLPCAGPFSWFCCLSCSLNNTDPTLPLNMSSHPRLLTSSHHQESACNAGDLGSIPGSGRSPGEGKGYPVQYSGLGNSTQSMESQSRIQLSDLHFFTTRNFNLSPKLKTKLRFLDGTTPGA